MDTHGRMDENRSPHEGQGPSGGAAERAGTNVARQLALAREKAELRCERDRMLLGLAKAFGPAGMARALGIDEEHAGAVLGRARERVEATGADFMSRPGAKITVRRLRTPAGARLSSLAPTGGATEGSGHPVQGRERMSRQHATYGAGGEPCAPPGDRWALADAHYEELGQLPSEGADGV